MGFFTNYKKYSFSISDKEQTILKYVMSLVESDLPFKKKPSSMIDKLNEIDVQWAPMMIFEDDSTYGMWTYTNVNSVFIRPDGIPDIANRINDRNFKLKTSYQEIVDKMAKQKTAMDAQFKNIKTLNKDLTLFVLYILESDGHAVSTVLHEMWHRHQFLSHPILYFISCLATNLMNYEKACTMKWSIEYDVREKVDNDDLKGKLKVIYQNFYEYLRLLNNIQSESISDEDREMIQKELDKSDDNIKKLIDLIKL